MLEELRVENLLLLERTELRLVPGLNVLTGETGAGKSLLASALDLLLGGKAKAGVVRSGAAEAYVEGTFSLPAELDPGRAGTGLSGDERIPADAEAIVLARRVWPDGRTRAYVCGRSATVADLRELGSRLLAFYGQHEHRKLMVTTAQLDALDAFCGPEQLTRRAEMAREHERVRALEARAGELAGAEGARERELDLIAFELREIEEVDPSEAEERELEVERDRLRHAEALRVAASRAAEALSPEEGSGAGALLTLAEGELDAVVRYDDALGPLAERLAAARYEAEDLASELRGYLDGFDEDSAGRLEFIEQRLDAFTRLARKHGGVLAEVLAHAERCRVRQIELTDSSASLEAIEADLALARSERDAVGDALHDARAEAAPRLAAAVVERLGELAMGDARFEVSLSDRPGGYGSRGRDTVEFRIAPNPGLPLGPLREVASGGELSRVMLALLSVAHGLGAGESGGRPGSRESGGRRESKRSDAGGGLASSGGGVRGGGSSPGDALLVFDEIDAGTGGHTANAVGRQLQALAAGRQVLCITHLPQIAALGDAHFTIVKDQTRSPAITTVAALEQDGVLDELVRMLGAAADDEAAVGHARELLRAT